MPRQGRREFWRLSGAGCTRGLFTAASLQVAESVNGRVGRALTGIWLSVENALTWQ